MVRLAKQEEDRQAMGSGKAFRAEDGGGDRLPKRKAGGLQIGDPLASLRASR